MANIKLIVSALSLHLMLVPFVLDLAYADQGLTLGFYKASCPSAEDIVKAKTKSYISRVPSLAPSLLRLHFHDCFVRVSSPTVLFYVLSFSLYIYFPSSRISFICIIDGFYEIKTVN